MRRRFVLPGIFLAVCLIVCGGCGSSNSNSSTTPMISSVSPSTIPAGEGQFILSVSGTNMNGSSMVNFGTDNLTPVQILNPPCPTGMNCVTTLEVVVPPVDVVNAGTVKVSVTTASQNSTTMDFTVASPQILTISPMAAAAGGAAFPLTVTVLNAAPSVQINFGTIPPLVPTGPISCNPATACAVTVIVPASAITTAGTVKVTVANPKATKGGTADATFVVAGSGQFPIEESANAGTPGDAASTHSSVSDGGLFVAFDSTAANLAGGATNGLSQVYLAQNCLGSGNCTAKLTLISAGSGGAGSGGAIGSDRPAISADGRYVVFESDDTDLASGATQAVEQIYLYDSCNSIFGTVPSCTAKLTLVSQGSGSAEGDAPSSNPSISAFGLYIAFQSAASNLTSATVPAGTQQIYVQSTCNAMGGAVSGCTPGLQLFSGDANGNAGDNNSVHASVDPAGLSIAFQSLADNIVSGIASNGAQQIYLRSTCLTGEPFLQTPCQQQTVLVSADSGNKPGVSDSVTPAVSGGSFVVYATRAANLLPANASGQQILGANICLSIPATVSCTPSGNLTLSVDQTGLPGQGDSSNPSIAGTRAVFTSLATLAPGVTGQQVYAANACIPPLSPCTASTTLISADAQGNPLGGDFGAVGGGGYATFSTVTSTPPQVFLAAPH